MLHQNTTILNGLTWIHHCKKSYKQKSFTLSGSSFSLCYMLNVMKISSICYGCNLCISVTKISTKSVSFNVHQIKKEKAVVILF